MNKLLDRLNRLLIDYRLGNITNADFSELKSTVGKVSDDDFNDIIEKQWSDFKSNRKLSKHKKDQILTHIKEKITLPEHKSHKRLWTSIAAVIVLLILNDIAIYLWTDFKNEQTMSEQHVEFVSGTSDESEVKLPDGSVVVLNKGSKLRYGHDFNAKNRVVELQGEGLFKVAKNKGKEFIVKTTYMNVCVLGTTFNVYAYDDDELVETTLIEGKVELTLNTPTHESMILSPEEKASYNKKTGEFKLVKTGHVTKPSWTKDTLVFKDTPLSEVFSCLERHFGVSFTFKNKAILNDLYTGRFNNDSLENILQILQWHYQFDYVIENKINNKQVIINN